MFKTEHKHPAATVAVLAAVLTATCFVPLVADSAQAAPVTQSCLDARVDVSRAVRALNEEATRINRHTRPLTLAQARSAALRASQAQHDRFVVTKAVLAGAGC